MSQADAATRNLQAAPAATAAPGVTADPPYKKPSPVLQSSTCCHCPLLPSRQRFKLSMKIHEYQAKELLAAAGAPIPRGIVVSSAAEAQKAFDELGGKPVVLKAQI